MVSSGNFSVEQVLEEVCSNGSDVGHSEPDYSLDDVIKRLVNKFYPLRRLLNNYSTFNVEATFCLGNVFKRNEARRSNMDRVMLSTSVWPMITAEVLMWVKCINWQMLATPKASVGDHQFTQH